MQVVRLAEADAKPPLLYTILQEGRPLLDRDGTWGRIRQRQQDVGRQAVATRSAQSRAARTALDSLRAPAG